jgi:hypothetical protein
MPGLAKVKLLFMVQVIGMGLPKTGTKQNTPLTQTLAPG